MSNEEQNGNFAKPMLAPVRVLNLYAGIGGNRKYWENVEVTAIEYNEEIANVYKQLHPNDNVIVADAHEYLANIGESLILYGVAHHAKATVK